MAIVNVNDAVNDFLGATGVRSIEKRNLELISSTPGLTVEDAMSSIVSNGFLIPNKNFFLTSFNISMPIQSVLFMRWVCNFTARLGWRSLNEQKIVLPNMNTAVMSAKTIVGSVAVNALRQKFMGNGVVTVG